MDAQGPGDAVVRLRPALPVPIQQNLPAAIEETRFRDDLSAKIALPGWLFLAAFFGVFGLWSVIAPLNGAVVANAVVKVEGNRKSLQHLDGGMVKELKIREGDRVRAGDGLIILDDTQARAEYDVLSHQQIVLRATEARLEAELNKARTLKAPPDIEVRLKNDQDVREAWNAQLRQFISWRDDLEGQRKVIRERINQLNEQIVGNNKQVDAYTQQMASLKKELASITPLVERGLIAEPRRLQLERSSYGLEGQIATAVSDIARAKQAIAEQSQQIAQVNNQRMTDVTKELRDAQALLLEVTPKLANAQAILGRMEIRAPYSGQVVGLTVFAVGAVIQRGERILDIVPDEDALTIEAQIAVEDISDVHPGVLAEVHLTAYKQRITPMVHGDVIQVSADRLTDSRTGQPYYTALIRVNNDELAVLQNVHLYPGMPAQVMIPTVARTAFDYLVGPLTGSFRTAFRQK